MKVLYYHPDNEKFVAGQAPLATLAKLFFDNSAVGDTPTKTGETIEFVVPVQYPTENVNSKEEMWGYDYAGTKDEFLDKMGLYIEAGTPCIAWLQEKYDSEKLPMARASGEVFQVIHAIGKSHEEILDMLDDLPPGWEFNKAMRQMFAQWLPIGAGYMFMGANGFWGWFNKTHWYDVEGVCVSENLKSYWSSTSADSTICHRCNQSRNTKWGRQVTWGFNGNTKKFICEQCCWDLKQALAGSILPPSA